MLQAGLKRSPPQLWQVFSSRVPCSCPLSFHPPLQVFLKTLADCQLAVSVFPTFSYNAADGGGSGSVRPGPDGRLQLTFDPASLVIPPINYQHAAILGVPVPPPLNIAIVPRRLEGFLDPATGRCELEFLVGGWGAGRWGLGLGRVGDRERVGRVCLPPDAGCSSAHPLRLPLLPSTQAGLL